MSNAASLPRERLINIREVEYITGLKRSSIYESPLSKRRVRISSRCVRWVESEVRAFVDDLILRSRTPTKSPSVECIQGHFG